MKTLAKKLKKERENVRYYKRRFEVAEMLAKECMKLEIEAREEIKRMEAVNKESIKYISVLANRLTEQKKEIILTMDEIKNAKEKDVKIEMESGKDGKIEKIKISRR